MAASLRGRAGQLKDQWPGYAPLVDFYVAVREAQKRSTPAVRMTRTGTGEPSADREAGKEFPRIGKEHFPIDIKSSTGLFTVLCGLGRTANPHFATQAQRIEQAVASGDLDLPALLAAGAGDGAAERAAAQRGLDARILSFLVLNSIRPSIEAARDQLLAGFEPKSWRKHFCPVCGSRPALSLLKGDPVLRHSLCSCCGCQWLVDRLSCSVCGNKSRDSLQYFHGEGEMTCRVDLCDECHHYIKTIDCRSLDASDPILEDLATLHLDVVATGKGYARAVPSLWGD